MARIEITEVKLNTTFLKLCQATVGEIWISKSNFALDRLQMGAKNPVSVRAEKDSEWPLEIEKVSSPVLCDHNSGEKGVSSIFSPSPFPYIIIILG